MSLLSWIF